MTSLREDPMAGVRRLWQDENGSLLSTEYIILGAILTIGLIVAFSSARDAIVTELEDYAASICELEFGVTAPTVTKTPAEAESP
jgi:Flp pilus assembly pilin Flp